MATRLKIARISKDISQEKLAEISEISRCTLMKIEKGDIAGVKVKTLRSIAKALDESVEELFFKDQV